MLFSALFVLAQALVFALGAPVVSERAGGDVTAASASLVSSFTPYIQLARAAYCTEGASVWTCGGQCSFRLDEIYCVEITVAKPHGFSNSCVQCHIRLSDLRRWG